MSNRPQANPLGSSSSPNDQYDEDEDDLEELQRIWKNIRKVRANTGRQPNHPHDDSDEQYQSSRLREEQPPLHPRQPQRPINQQYEPFTRKQQQHKSGRHSQLSDQQEMQHNARMQDQQTKGNLQHSNNHYNRPTMPHGVRPPHHQLSSNERNRPSNSQYNKKPSWRNTSSPDQVISEPEQSERYHGQRQSGRSGTSSVKKAIYKEEQKNLETRLSMTERQLAKARENTAILMKKLSEAQAYVEELELNMDALQTKVSSIGTANQIITQEQMAQREAEVQKLLNSFQNNLKLRQTQLVDKEREIERLNLKINSNQYQMKNILRQNGQLANAQAEAAQRADLAQKTINDIYLSEQSKGVEMLELEDAKQTIERLITLLRQSNDYARLAEFLQDTKDAHFLRKVGRRMKGNEIACGTGAEKRKLCSCSQVRVDERLLWTPSTCYRILLDMKMKYSSLTEDCIEEALFQLNKIWNGHLDAQLGRQREAFETENNRLRKRAEERYDQLVARKQIERLKKQLHDIRMSGKGGGRGQAETLEVLKAIGHYEDQLKIKQKQIRLLQDRIKLLQGETENNDRAIYLQGALWVIDKVLAEVALNVRDFADFEEKFRSKLQQWPRDQPWTGPFKELAETANELNNSLMERLAAMKDSAAARLHAHNAPR